MKYISDSLKRIDELVEKESGFEYVNNKFLLYGKCIKTAGGREVILITRDRLEKYLIKEVFV